MKKQVRVKRFDKIVSSVDPQLLSALINLLTKIIGESVKDKVVRAILVGVLGALGNYVATGPALPAPVEQGVPQQETPQVDKPPR